jgi:hypothetical protein
MKDEIVTPSVKRIPGDLYADALVGPSLLALQKKDKGYTRQYTL